MLAVASSIQARGNGQVICVNQCNLWLNNRLGIQQLFTPYSVLGTKQSASKKKLGGCRAFLMICALAEDHHGGVSLRLVGAEVDGFADDAGGAVEVGFGLAVYAGGVTFIAGGGVGG